MFGAFERLVAWRYLRSRRQEGFISVIAWFSLAGILLGVATLIIVMSVMNGFRQELLGRILGLNGHVTVSAFASDIPGFDALADRIRAIDGVVSATPLVEGQVMATANGVASGALVRGMRLEDLRAKSILAGNIVAGSLAGTGANTGVNTGTDIGIDIGGGAGAADGVIVGGRMAQRMGLKIGDRLTLISPQSSPSPFGGVPRQKAYPVAAVFNVGMYEYDNTFIYMPLEQAQLFFRHPDAATAIEVMVRDADGAPARAQAIRAAVGPDYRVLDWQQVNASFFTALQVERNVMFLILTLIILVAAFNIISSQIMLVNDKARGVAILRTMGATKGMVLRIFLMTGASVGIVGTILGGALGMAFALNIESIRQWIQSLTRTELFSAEIYFLSQLPAKVEPSEVVTVIVMALSLSFLATLYPAWRAARLDPVEVLRYE